MTREPDAGLVYLQDTSGVEAFTFGATRLARLQALHPHIRWQLCSEGSEFQRLLPACRYAVVWRFKAGWYAEARRLDAVFTPAAGRDWVEPDPAGRVPTFHGSFHGRIMAETLLAMVLFFARRFDRAIEAQSRKAWDRMPYSSLATLSGQKALIVGHGAIGAHCGRLLAAVGIQVTGIRRNPESSAGTPYPVLGMDALEASLPEAHHVALILPGDDSTRGLITEGHFRRMRRGAFLYNLGRGTCYREEDVIAALRSGILAGAFLDVFAGEPLPAHSPLWETPGCFVYPHASAIASTYLDLYLDELVDQLRSLSAGSASGGGTP